MSGQMLADQAQEAASSSRPAETAAGEVSRTSWGSARSAWAVAGLIGLMSIVYAVAMFRGLEPHSVYFGSAYQALHPGSFAGDPFMDPGRPTVQSLYYTLVRMVGPLWLDDRFGIVVFACLGIVSLLGLDRTVRLFGAERFSERVGMLALMLVEHRLLSNHAVLIDNYEFNPTTLAAPAIAWLLYAALSGAGLARLGVLAALAALISVKNAWLPIMCAGLLWSAERPRPFQRRLAVGAGLAMSVVAFGYYMTVRPADGTHAALFDYLVQSMDNREANPFLDPWWANLLFVALCLAGLAVRVGPEPVARRFHRVAALGLSAWLAGGLYFTFAPDALKIPYVVPFDVTRALWWMQYVLFVGLGVWLLRRIDRAPSWPGGVSAWILLMLLLVAHVEPRLKIGALTIGLTAILAALAAIACRRRPGGMVGLAPSMRLPLIGTAMCLGVLGAYTIGTVRHRREALGSLIRHGVMGDNGSAKWVGVSDYLRAHTPQTATVLALSVQELPGQEARLQFDGALRTRAGRSMPLGHPAAFYFDYAKLQWWEGQVECTEALAGAWQRRDAPEITAELSALGSPDYLVVPTAHAQWLGGLAAFPYTVETAVDGFTILRRASAG